MPGLIHGLQPATVCRQLLQLRLVQRVTSGCGARRAGLLSSLPLSEQGSGAPANMGCSSSTHRHVASPIEQVEPAFLCCAQ